MYNRFVEPSCIKKTACRFLHNLSSNVLEILVSRKHEENMMHLTHNVYDVWTICSGNARPAECPVTLTEQLYVTITMHLWSTRDSGPPQFTRGNKAILKSMITTFRWILIRSGSSVLLRMHQARTLPSSALQGHRNVDTSSRSDDCFSTGSVWRISKSAIMINITVYRLIFIILPWSSCPRKRRIFSSSVNSVRAGTIHSVLIKNDLFDPFWCLARTHSTSSHWVAQLFVWHTQPIDLVLARRRHLSRRFRAGAIMDLASFRKGRREAFRSLLKSWHI